MSSISGISNAVSSSYEGLASGKRINHAADDAAGLAIAEKENIQVSGYEAGANNMASAKDALNVADGALSSINDYLQRIRELALSASNTATVTDSDRNAMQKEVSQLLQGIEDVAKNTSYNTKPLLDGSQTEFGLVTDANGSSMSFNTANATLSALGMDGFDLTGKFSISTIDNAISKVSEARSAGGAKTNAFEYAMNYNSAAKYYATASKSRIEDLDYPQAISEQKKNEALLQYSLLMQRKKQEQEAGNINALFKGL